MLNIVVKHFVAKYCSSKLLKSLTTFILDTGTAMYDIHIHTCLKVKFASKLL